MSEREDITYRLVAFKFGEQAEMRGMHLLGKYGLTCAYSDGVYICPREQAEKAAKQLIIEGLRFHFRTDIDSLDFKTGFELAARDGWMGPEEILIKALEDPIGLYPARMTGLV